MPKAKRKKLISELKKQQNGSPYQGLFEDHSDDEREDLGSKKGKANDGNKKVVKIKKTDGNKSNEAIDKNTGENIQTKRENNKNVLKVEKLNIDVNSPNTEKKTKPKIKKQKHNNEGPSNGTRSRNHKTKSGTKEDNKIDLNKHDSCDQAKSKDNKSITNDQTKFIEVIQDVKEDKPSSKKQDKKGKLCKENEERGKVKNEIKKEKVVKISEVLFEEPKITMEEGIENQANAKKTKSKKNTSEQSVTESEKKIHPNPIKTAKKKRKKRKAKKPLPSNNLLRCFEFSMEQSNLGTVTSEESNDEENTNNGFDRGIIKLETKEPKHDLNSQKHKTKGNGVNFKVSDVTQTRMCVEPALEGFDTTEDEVDDLKISYINSSDEDDSDIEDLSDKKQQKSILGEESPNNEDFLSTETVHIDDTREEPTETTSETAVDDTREDPTETTSETALENEVDIEGKKKTGDTDDDGSDSDIEILKVIIKTNSDLGEIIKTEIKEEKGTLDLLHSVSNTDIKQEYDNKYLIQEQLLSKANHKIRSLEKNFNALFEKIKEKDVANLEDLSKIIDKKNPTNSIMPEFIDIPDESPDDEVLASPISSPSPVTKDHSKSNKRQLPLESSHAKSIKLHKTDDIFFSPSRASIHVMSGSDSENEEEIIGQTLKTKKNQFKDTSNYEDTGKSTCLEIDCDHASCNNQIVVKLCRQNPQTCTGSHAPCSTSSCTDPCTHSSCSSGQSFQPHEGGSSSRFDARTNNLNNFRDYERKPRSTGIQSHASLDWSKNQNVPEEFWVKHTWADKTNTMCDPGEMDEYIFSHNLEHVADEIAFWFCTAWPINLYDRRYWSYNHPDGSVWVSKTLAQSKNFVLRGKQIDPLDRCVICSKILVSEYHVFMPVYLYQDNPPKALIWKWQNSREKACYIHFQSSRSEEIPGRNPNQFGKEPRRQGGSRQFNLGKRLPLPKVRQLNVKVPDEY